MTGSLYKSVIALYLYDNLSEFIDFCQKFTIVEILAVMSYYKNIIDFYFAKDQKKPLFTL